MGGGLGHEIIAGDSWQRGAGDGVMDGSNVHSPTERGLLRDDHPTEIDKKTFFNVERRHKGHQGEEKMVVATSQATRQKYQPVSIDEEDTAADPPSLPTIEAFDDEADQLRSTLPSLTSSSAATTNKTPATTEVKITTPTSKPVTTISETRTPLTLSAVNANSISTTVTLPPASSTSRATTAKATTTKATTTKATTTEATTTNATPFKATTTVNATTDKATTAKATTAKATTVKATTAKATTAKATTAKAKTTRATTTKAKTTKATTTKATTTKSTTTTGEAAITSASTQTPAPAKSTTTSPTITTTTRGTTTTFTTTTITTTTTTTITTSTTTPATTTTTSPSSTTAAKRVKNIDEIISAQNVLEKKVELEISDGIDQLKSDLKMLLVFNDNIQEASHQIVKEATKAKVETFFKSVSSSLSMLTLKKPKESAENNEDVQVEPSSKEDIEKIEAADMKKKEEDVKMATSILHITKDISKGLAATVEVGGTMEIQLEDISMAVMKKRLDSNSQAGQSSVWQSEELSVELPDQSSIAGADSSITLAFTSYNTLGEMMTKTDEISSPVLSVNVIGVEDGGKSIPLTKPLEFVLRHQNMSDFSHRKCVYWDFDIDSWSEDGCYAVREKSSADRTSCQCYHLTNFAVLVDVYGLARTEEHKGTLNILTYIGCSISLVSLIICITVFSTFRSAQNDRSSINTNLCACLLVAELVFLLGIGQTDFPSACSVVAVILHYLFLASSFWMLIAGFQIYVLLVEVFEPDNCRYVQYYMLGYIAPLLMVLFSLLVDTLFNNVTVYGSADFCWIKGNIHLVLTFLAPVFCIVCVNIYFLSVAVWKIHIHSRDAL